MVEIGTISVGSIMGQRGETCGPNLLETGQRAASTATPATPPLLTTQATTRVAAQTRASKSKTTPTNKCAVFTRPKQQGTVFVPSITMTRHPCWWLPQALHALLVQINKRPRINSNGHSLSYCSFEKVTTM